MTRVADRKQKMRLIISVLRLVSVGLAYVYALGSIGVYLVYNIYRRLEDLEDIKHTRRS